VRTEQKNEARTVDYDSKKFINILVFGNQSIKRFLDRMMLIKFEKLKRKELQVHNRIAFLELVIIN